MSQLLRVESTLTDRYQTTIPELIRESLHLDKRDKIVFTLGEDGSVFLSRAEESDPVLGDFLSFIASDIQNNPKNIKTIPLALVERAQSLVGGMKIDLDSALNPEDDE